MVLMCFSIIIGETVCENFSDKNALSYKSAWANGAWFGLRPEKKQRFDESSEDEFFINGLPVPLNEDSKRGIKFTPRLGRQFYSAYPIQDELSAFIEQSPPKRSKFTPRLGRSLVF